MHTPRLLPIVLAELSPAAALAVFAIWLLVFGGAIGSFLNVVIYRLPAGKSLVYPGSHCPMCRHAIRWYDNVPVLAWFLLRGRCRDCGSRISVRYPIVEAITAGLFVLVGLVEGLSGGTNLPLPLAVDSAGVTLPPLDLGQSALVVAYHLLLLCTLLAAALIQYDGHRVPVRLFAPALMVGWVAPLVWPYLHPVCAERAVAASFSGSVAAWADGTAGLGLGMLLGLGFWRWPNAKRGFGLLLGPACVGLFLGGKAILVITIASAFVGLLLWGLGQAWPPLRRFPPTSWLFLLAPAWILAWGPIARYWPLFGEPLF